MSNSVLVDLHEIDKLVADLRKFAAKGIPFAARKSLNETAFEARKRWQARIEKTFTLRNTYVVRSLRVVRASGSFAGGSGAMHSEVGSFAPFMLMQEQGGTEKPKGGRHRGIPQPAAAGQSQGSQRTKAVRSQYKQPAIKLGAAPKGGRSKKQRNAIAIRMALAKGKRFVLLESETARGIFSIKGQGRVGKALSGRKVKTSTRMVWNLKHRTQRVPPTNTLKSTLHEMEDVIPGIHVAALLAQLRHHGVKGYEGAE
jgi:hypothetical protein